LYLSFFACGFTFHKKLTVGPGKLQQNNNQVIKKRWLRDMSMCNVFHMKWRINNNVIYRKRLLHHVPIKFLTTYCKIHHVILFYGANFWSTDPYPSFMSKTKYQCPFNSMHLIIYLLNPSTNLQHNYGINSIQYS
jgi:hypothetical protein